MSRIQSLLLHGTSIAVLLCIAGVGSARACPTYLPDPTAFPLTFVSNGSAHITITSPGGALLSEFDVPFTQSPVFGDPIYYLANLLPDPTTAFAACGTAFLPVSGTYTTQAQIFAVTTTITAAKGVIDIIEDGTNNQPANDGNPCTAAAPCQSDDIHFVKTHHYEIVSGRYSLTEATHRHSIWLDPATGNSVDTEVNQSGAAAGVVPVIRSGLDFCELRRIIHSSYRKRTGQPGFDARADLNGDGIVNRLDLAALRALAGGRLNCDAEDEAD
jgi:hypothetical protein